MPLRHPLSPQMSKVCRALIWAPPLLKNPGSAPDFGFILVIYLYSKLLEFMTYFILFCPKCFDNIQVIWFLISSCPEICHTVRHLTYTFLYCSLPTAVSYC